MERGTQEKAGLRFRLFQKEGQDIINNEKANNRR